ncbi:MAG: pantoate--beta-alanine ligase [Candidatus Omnitrophota bacterium]
MIITRSIYATRKAIARAKERKEKIGFVPTMGALHEGHLSLVRRAGKECDFVAVSIFVNPAQFGPKEDFKKYPRAFRRDSALLGKEHVDLLFVPSVKEMYDSDFSTYVEETYLGRVLCGLSRPGHFKGVCTVVTKLFNIITPDLAYVGQKDYQQAEIIRRLVQDLNFPVTVRVAPIVREDDGLAISSRNKYLSVYERKQALSLSQALRFAKNMIRTGERSPQKVIRCLRNMIDGSKDAKIDYIKIIDPRTLRDVTRIKGKVAVVLAVYIGKTRLIDNEVMYAR